MGVAVVGSNAMWGATSNQLGFRSFFAVLATIEFAPVVPAASHDLAYTSGL
jgi:hypothetical protein